MNRLGGVSSGRGLLAVQMKLLDRHGPAHFLFKLAQWNLSGVLHRRIVERIGQLPVDQSQVMFGTKNASVDIFIRVTLDLDGCAI